MHTLFSDSDVLEPVGEWSEHPNRRIAESRTASGGAQQRRRINAGERYLKTNFPLGNIPLSLSSESQAPMGYQALN